MSRRVTRIITDGAGGGGGLTAIEHARLRQLIHLADNGPMEYWASGAYKEILPAAAPFPTSVTWWTDVTKTLRIVDKTYTYTGIFPTTIEWRAYDVDGATILATVTDTLTYLGPFEVSRVRATSP